jgi:ribosomal protein S6--L-glutamate ligase
MRLVVLGSPQSWYLHDLRRAAGDRHEVLSATFRELAAGVLGIDQRVHSPHLSPLPKGEGATDEHFSSGASDLVGIDAVLVRTMPPGSLEQVVFRMDVLGRLEEAGKVVLNPARAIEAAVDKYLATAKLHAAGLTTPPTWVAQTVEDALGGFDALGQDVVVKPLFGAEGRGIVRIADRALAERTFSLLIQLGAVVYLQQFVEHDGFDLRVLVVGRRALGMRRRNPLDWRTNISRGAAAEPLELTDELVELARRAAEAVGAPLAGVDLLPGRDGRLYVLEVNAVPGWQALARATGVDVARLVLDYVEDVVKAEGGGRKAEGWPRPSH